MIRFLVDVLRCQSERGRLRVRVGMLEADNTYLRKQVEWAKAENEGLLAMVAGLERELRRVSREALKACGHPAMRAELKRVTPWN